ncbi:hypothetical protein QOZ98_001184 [Planomicrobium stackebrandtii]|uniref:Uncharacterized protein n=1 Tax=Planomicrobium stackebrandtii TaxID=253160 RepID=A0ABU0GSL4_9BACL|nr:DUF5693 family protein [Planomicrobium stackebrandtii]MDQ0428358.1 hypothetical protein [Planomicrobium stackebrandtii]
MKKVLIGILLAALLLTIPSAFQRIQIEESNKKIETIIPYKLMTDWIVQDPALTPADILADFKNAGIQSVSLEPDTVSSLERKGLITAVSTPRMREHLLLTQQDPLEAPFDKPGLFVHSNGTFNFEEITAGFFEEKFTYTVNDEEYLYIPGEASSIQSTPIGYDSEVIASIQDAGLKVVPRLGDYSDEEQTERMIGELLTIKQPDINKVLFSGNAVPAGSDPVRLKEFGEQLKEAGYGLLSIEFAGQEGLNQLAYVNDLNLVRLHSLGLTNDNIAESAEKIVRAAKERNMRAFFVNMTIVEYEQALSALRELQTEVDRALPASFVRGDSRTFDTYSVPLWQTAMALLGAIAFLTLAAQSVFKNKWLTLAALVGSALAAILYLVTAQSMILKAFALAIAITAPIWAVLLKKEPEKKWYLLRSYAQALAISAIGIWLIVVLLNGNQYLLGIDLFRGVSLIYIVPIAFVAIYAIFGNIKKLLKLNVIYWHVVVIAVVAAVALYYMSRTGNAGQVSTIELQARLLMEQILYVRPRTKEFLIGFPLFILALHVAKSYPKAYYFLLIPGVIGFLSLVNTFTHLHIPLLISLLRSGYSIVFGFIIGLILIWLYEKFWKKMITIIRMRWQD